MFIKYKGSVKGSRQEMLPLKNHISAVITAGDAFKFTSIDGTIFLNKFDAFETIDDTYLTKKASAQIARQKSYIYLKKIKKDNWRVATFLKALYRNNTKKLLDWGVPVLIGKQGGVIPLNMTLKETELTCRDILAKHNADGVASVLQDFDMITIQDNYDAYVLLRDEYKTAQDVWRGLAVGRKKAMLELRRMQHAIASELIANPSFNNRELETMGYILIENHNYNTQEEAESISA